MKGYRMILECGCEETWYEGDLFPGIGGIAECMGSDIENCDKTGLERGQTHQMQKIVAAWEEEF